MQEKATENTENTEKTTEATDNSNINDDKATTDGCGSSIAITALATISILGAAVIIKKKH